MKTNRVGGALLALVLVSGAQAGASLRITIRLVAKVEVHGPLEVRELMKRYTNNDMHICSPF